jgi:hypothetical protein
MHPSPAKFQDNINILIVLKKSMESHHICMVQTAMDSYFLRQFILLIVLGHQFLGDNFTSIHIASLCICYFITLCKTTLEGKKGKLFNFKDLESKPLNQSIEIKFQFKKALCMATKMKQKNRLLPFQRICLFCMLR